MGWEGWENGEKGVANNIFVRTDDAIITKELGWGVELFIPATTGRPIPFSCIVEGGSATGSRVALSLQYVAFCKSVCSVRMIPLVCSLRMIPLACSARVIPLACSVHDSIGRAVRRGWVNGKRRALLIKSSSEQTILLLLRSWGWKLGCLPLPWAT